jgi:hypothetical protein
VAHAEEFGRTGGRQYTGAVDHRFALDKSALPCAFQKTSLVSAGESLITDPTVK